MKNNISPIEIPFLVYSIEINEQVCICSNIHIQNISTKNTFIPPKNENLISILTG